MRATTLRFDFSRNLLRTGKMNNVAASIFGDKYTTTAKMYNDGWFRPSPNQLLIVLLSPVGLSEVYA